MNRLVKAVVFSLSGVFAATSAFAAPHEQPNKPAQMQKHQTVSKFEQQKVKPASHQVQQKASKKVEQPKRDWKVGHKLPNQFHAPSYKVDYKQSKKLSKPGKNQQWIKVNGDYVLMNTTTYKVLKVVG